MDRNDLYHDINSSIASLKSAVEIMEQAWLNDAEIVDKIIPLASDKLIQLHNLIKIHSDVNLKD